MIKKLLFIMISLISFCSVSQALLLEFINLNVSSLVDRFTEVHFMGSGNDFGGAFFWTPAISFSFPQSITISGDQRDCYKMAKWLYYNSQRGNRIRPLDPHTLAYLQNENPNYNNLTISGWLYSVCDDNIFNLYGQITYNRSGTESHLSVWTELDYDNNRLRQAFSQNFEYYNNKLPIWYFTDSVWWIWFLWWLFSGHQCLICLLNGDDCSALNCGATCTWDSISDFFDTDGNEIRTQSGCNFWFSGGSITGNIWNIQRWLTVQWTIGLSQSNTTIWRNTLLWNFQEKTSVINAPNFNVSTLINQTKQQAQQLYRWQKNYANTTIPTPYSEDIIYIGYDDYSSGNQIVIDLDSVTGKQLFLNKTLIIENWDLVLLNSLQKSDGYLDVFVDNWNLYIENLSNPTLQNFNDTWYPTLWTGVTQWTFLQWTIIINWLILSKSWNLLEWYNHKLYIHGRLNSLSTPLAPSLGRVQQIQSLFNTTEYSPRINLQYAFTWICNPITWNGSDGVVCFDDPLADSNIIIIGNQNYPSRLLQSN